MTTKNPAFSRRFFAPSWRFLASLGGTCVWFFILVFALVPLLSGCAFLNPDNTPTLNFVKDHMVPESTTGKVIATPFVYPVGLAAVVVDAVIVHPLTVIDDAADDTKDCLWVHFDWDKKYVTECAALPWRAIVTPGTFLGDFLGRAMFDIPERAYKTKKGAENRERLSKVRDLVEANDIEGLRKQLAEKRWWDDSGLSQEEMAEMNFLHFKARYLIGDLESGKFSVLGLQYEVGKLWETKWKPDVEAILQKMKTSENPLSRFYAYTAKMQVSQDESEKLAIFREAMKDEDPVLRFRMLESVSRFGRKAPADFKSDFENLSRDDSNPTIRATAAKMVE